MTEMEEEINLIDIVKVLVKRKVLIITGTVLCLLLSVAISLLIPKVFKVSFVADIGMIQWGTEMKPIESPTNVKSKVEMAYSYSAMDALDIPEDDFPEVIVRNPKKTMLIEGSVKTSEPSEGVKILKHIQEQLLKDHEKLVNQYRVGIQNAIKTIDLDISDVHDKKKVINEKLKILKTNIENTKMQIGEAKQRIDDLQKEKKRVNVKANPDNTLSLLVFTNEVQENQRYYNQLQNKLDSTLANQQVTFENNLLNNEREKKKLELQRLDVESKLEALQDTRVIKEPSYSEKPVSPKKRLIILLAAVIGLMGSIFLAFFMEFIDKYRQEQDLIEKNVDT